MSGFRDMGLSIEVLLWFLHMRVRCCHLILHFCNSVLVFLGGTTVGPALRNCVHTTGP